MAELETRIQKDIMAAMKAKDTVRLNAVRSIKTAVLVAKTAEGAKEIEDADIVKIIGKLAKQRKEAAEQYTAAGRQELADNELAEAAILDEYLPKMLTEEETEARLREIIAQVGAKAPSDMGKVMGVATKQLAGLAEGRTISMLVKKILSSLAVMLLLVMTGFGAGAQTKYFKTPSPEGWVRTSSTQRQSEYPKVNAKGEYWFRFKAPETAKDVKVNFCSQDFPAQLDREGYWNVITKSPKVGFNLYYIVIDGVRYADPGAELVYCNGWTAYMEVPSPEDSYYQMKNVPHGEVREHWFWSDVAHEWRRAYVYTPAEYETNPDKRYPVLYLQHGAGEMEFEWTHSGFAAIIADNMIAEGTVEPMIIVMNNDFVYRPGDRRGRLAMADTWSENFNDMFINESIPDIDKSYRTIADPGHRAMAGLSLGGMLTNNVGLGNSSMFAYYGIFSGGVASDPGKIDKSTVKLVFETCGELEYPERIAENARLLNGMGIKAATYVSPDTAHEWQTWRRSLHEFLPLIFKD